MLRFVPDHLKTKNIWKKAAQNLPFIIRNVPDQYKAQEICDRVIRENGGSSMFIPDFYQIKKMCNKGIDDYPRALEIFPDCYKSQKIRNKAVHNYSFAIQFVSECCKTREMCDKDVDTYPFVLDSALDWYIVSENPFILKHALIDTRLKKYMIKAVDACLQASKCFGSKMGIMIILTLMMFILMRMILKVLFLPDLWFVVMNINNANHITKISKKLMPAA